MLPLYRPGTKPPVLQVTNLQRRVVHTQPLFVDSSSSPRGAVIGEELLFPPSTMASGAPSTTTKRNLGLWIGGTVVVFWIILVSLFFISHVVASSSRHAATTVPPRYQSVSFSMLPTQGRFLNVSLLFPWLAQVGWHRTCCWHKEQELHCDGGGAFVVHVDKRESTLVVRIIQPELIGAQCTFHAWSATNAGGVGYR